MKTFIGETRQYLTANILLLSIVFFFGAAVFWACNARLDEVVRGNGRVIPSTQIKTIQNLEGGILSEILVREGEKIRAGQVLMQMDPTVFQAGVKETLAEKYSLEAKIARLTAESKGSDIEFSDYLRKERPRLVEQQIALKEARAAKLSSDLEILDRSQEKYRLEIREIEQQNRHLAVDLNIINKKLSIMAPLVEKQAASTIELLDLEKQKNQLMSQIENNKSRILKIKAAIKTAQSQKKSLQIEFSNTVLKELTDLKNRLEQLEQLFPAIKDRLERTQITSPVSGFVKRIFVHTAGGVVAPGAPLVEIVPEKDDLLVEARILPKDIAFVHPGQKVNVRFTAYDFSIYGGIDGNIEHISADAILGEEGYSYFLIRVRLEDNQLEYKGRKLPVIPGMDCQVDALSGSKTVMDYILKPVLKARHTALTER